MNIFLLLTIAMLMIILMLRRHIPIGPCMLASGIFIWLMKAPVLLSLLPDTFDTKTAIAIGKELQNVSERTVMNYLKELCRSRLLRKSKAGHYEKIIYDKSGKI